MAPARNRNQIGELPLFFPSASVHVEFCSYSLPNRQVRLQFLLPKSVLIPSTFTGLVHAGFHPRDYPGDVAM